MSERMLHFNRRTLNGTITIPGDKSISHRSIIFSSLAKGTTEITNFLPGEDCMLTIEAFRKLGVTIDQKSTQVIVKSTGYQSFKDPNSPIYLGNSGTGARLLIGLFAGLPIFTVLYGDKYLSERPMDRVVEPLRQMGAHITGRENGNKLPIAIDGQTLTGIEYTLPVKSAQVKSAVLLAGLFAEGKTIVHEDTKTRDHTEKMMESFKSSIHIKENTATITPSSLESLARIHIPGDISSAAFMLAAGAIVPESQITLTSVGLNETRTGIIDVLKQMGAMIEITPAVEKHAEPYGDIEISHTDLIGTTIDGDLIPRLIDEIPLIALIATQAQGNTIIRNAEELRVKETDRIQAVVEVLQTFGAKIQETDDGMIIEGKTPLHGGKVSAYGDHRMAMMATIASFITDDPVTIDDVSSIDISFPTFFEDLEQLMHSQP